MSFSQLLQRVVVAVAGAPNVIEIIRFCYTDLIWLDSGYCAIK